MTQHGGNSTSRSRDRKRTRSSRPSLDPYRGARESGSSSNSPPISSASPDSNDYRRRRRGSSRHRSHRERRRYSRGRGRETPPAKYRRRGRPSRERDRPSPPRLDRPSPRHGRPSPPPPMSRDSFERQFRVSRSRSLDPPRPLPASYRPRRETSVTGRLMALANDGVENGLGLGGGFPGPPGGLGVFPAPGGAPVWSSPAFPPHRIPDGFPDGQPHPFLPPMSHEEFYGMFYGGMLPPTGAPELPLAMPLPPQDLLIRNEMRRKRKKRHPKKRERMQNRKAKERREGETLQRKWERERARGRGRNRRRRSRSRRKPKRRSYGNEIELKSKPSWRSKYRSPLRKRSERRSRRHRSSRQRRVSSSQSRSSSSGSYSRSDRSSSFWSSRSRRGSSSGSSGGSSEGGGKRGASGGSSRTSGSRRLRGRRTSRGSGDRSVRHDKEGHLIYNKGDMIAGRYEIESTLGEGTFGRVVQCADTFTTNKNRKKIALKIIRNVEKYRDAAKLEIKVLEKLSEADPQGSKLCVKLLDWFNFHGHICLAFDLLGLSIFDYLKANKYAPYPMSQVRHIAHQLCVAVEFMHANKLTHTDLKPENILFIDPDLGSGNKRRPLRSTELRLIDFGSATFDHEHHSTIVSTRHYRAIEVILEIGWSQPCDVWSIGCILFEIYSGITMFQTHDNREHLAIMETVLGPVPPKLVKRSRRGGRYFNSRGAVDVEPGGSIAKYVKENIKYLERYMLRKGEEDELLFHLIRQMLHYEPNHRITLTDALHHAFFRPIYEQFPHHRNGLI